MALVDNLISYYKLDENAANTTVTDSHASNTGTSSTNTSNLTTTGKINEAFNFVGVNFEFVDCNFTPITNSSFTWNWWVKASDSAAGMMLASPSVADTDGVQIHLSSGKLDVTSGGGGSTQVLGQSTTDVDDDSWHMCTLVYNGTNGLIYVDGGTAEVDTTWSPLASVVDLYLGRRGIRSANYFTGDIDEVSIFSAALSESEIGELYNSGNGLIYPFPLPNPNKGTKGTADISKLDIPDGIGDTQNLIPEGINGVTSTVLSKDRVGLEL